MDISDIKEYEDERGKLLLLDGIEYVTRKEGTTSANHTHKEHEIIYLVEGEMEFTLGKETEIIKSSKKINIPSNVYHKVVALTDIVLVADKRNN